MLLKHTILRCFVTTVNKVYIWTNGYLVIFNIFFQPHFYCDIVVNIHLFVTLSETFLKYMVEY